MIINNGIVKTESKFNSIGYKFFACTCDDKDKEFYKKIIEIFYPEANSQMNANRRATYFVRKLWSLGWKFNGCGADMWMGALFTKESNDNEPKKTMFIECDELETGLVAALMIAKGIEKEQR